MASAFVKKNMSKKTENNKNDEDDSKNHYDLNGYNKFYFKKVLNI
jgi:hypothetical protein